MAINNVRNRVLILGLYIVGCDRKCCERYVVKIKDCEVVLE